MVVNTHKIVLSSDPVHYSSEVNCQVKSGESLICHCSPAKRLRLKRRGVIKKKGCGNIYLDENPFCERTASSKVSGLTISYLPAKSFLT
jgi:hypothetical protein